MVSTHDLRFEETVSGKTLLIAVHYIGRYQHRADTYSMHTHPLAEALPILNEPLDLTRPNEMSTKQG